MNVAKYDRFCVFSSLFVSLVVVVLVSMDGQKQNSWLLLNTFFESKSLKPNLPISIFIRSESFNLNPNPKTQLLVNVKNMHNNGRRIQKNSNRSSPDPEGSESL